MKKTKNFEEPKKLAFTFVLEGKCEYWYLELLRKHEMLNINFAPKLPQKKNLQDQYKKIETLVEESEKVFWIIDFDTILKETRETKKGDKTRLQEFKELYDRCKVNEKIIIIVNNPCLEYWFLQHFERTAKCFGTYKQLEKPLKKHLPDYEKTEKYYNNSRQNIYQKLKPYLSIAKANAEKLGEFNLDNAQKAVTEMYKIFNLLECCEQARNSVIDKFEDLE